jgi:hypothetical protein
MTIAVRLRKVAKRLINKSMKCLNVKWYDLVDVRVRLLMVLGPKRVKPKVFIVGMNKTGTSSLGESMREMGYLHLSYSPFAISAFDNKDFDTLEAILDSFDSFDDKPWNNPALWPLMKKKCPNALWVYTFRDVRKWMQSYRNYSEQNGAFNEVDFIESPEGESFAAQHIESAKVFENSNNLSFVWLDCDRLSFEGSAILSLAMGREVKIGHHNRSQSNKS